MPDIGHVIERLGVDFRTTDVEMKRGTGEFRHDVFTLEPETIEKITVGRNDDGGIFIGDDLDELGRLRKVLVSRVLRSEERDTCGIRDVHVLCTLRSELNEGTRHIYYMGRFSLRRGSLTGEINDYGGSGFVGSCS